MEWENVPEAPEMGNDVVGVRERRRNEEEERDGEKEKERERRIVTGTSSVITPISPC